MELKLAVFGHLVDLGLDAVFDDLFDGFAEDVGVPDAAVFVAAFSDIGDQILRLLFGSDDRGDFGFDRGPDQGDRRRLGVHFHAVFISVPDDGGLFQRDFFPAGRYDAVTFVAHAFQGVLHLLVFCPQARQLA